MILLCSDYDGTLHFKNENGSGYFKPEDLKEIKIFQEKETCSPFVLGVL